MSYEDHLKSIRGLLEVLWNLPNVLDRLAGLPPGSGDTAEALALTGLLDQIGATRDGSSAAPGEVCAEELGYSMGDMAKVGPVRLQDFVRAVQSRLDRLVAGGVRWEGIVSAADFGSNGITFAVFEKDTSEGRLNVPLTFGRYRYLAKDHPLRRALSEADCYSDHGEPVVDFGVPQLTGSGYRSVPYLPLKDVVRRTKVLARVQQEGWRAVKEKEAAEQEARWAAAQEAKPPDVRRLEAQIAEQGKKIADLMAKLGRDEGRGA